MYLWVLAHVPGDLLGVCRNVSSQAVPVYAQLPAPGLAEQYLYTVGTDYNVEYCTKIVNDMCF